MKTIQLFIHRNYEAIRLSLLVVLVLLSAFAILSQLAYNDAAARRRAAVVSDVAEQVRIENENQTKIINRQFRALCIIIIETSGQEGLDKLDPESKKKCENLSMSESEELSGESVSPSAQTQSSPASPSSSANNTPHDSTPQPDNSQSEPSQPEAPDNDGILLDLPLLPKVHIPSPL